MSIELLRAFFGWCTVINGGVLLLRWRDEDSLRQAESCSVRGAGYCGIGERTLI